MCNSLDMYFPKSNMRPYELAFVGNVNFESNSKEFVSVLHAVAQLAEALCYKPKGSRVRFRLCHWNFSSHDPSGRTMALGSTRPLTEMSNRIFFLGGGGI
jgi:hypothetical protein